MPRSRTSKTNKNAPRAKQALLAIPPSLQADFFLMLAETFKILGDTSRIRIVWLLAEGEFNVNQLCEQMDMSQPAVSHHLRQLRNSKLVRVRREGTTAFYSLDDEHINLLLKAGADHVGELLL